MTDGQYTSFTGLDGSVKEGVACSNCRKPYDRCTKELLSHGGVACCGVCRNTGTHRERDVWVSMDPNAHAPRDGDRVLYTANDDSVFGGVAIEARMDDDKLHRFRIIGHEGLFNHTPQPPWKDRRILRPATPPAPALDPGTNVVHQLDVALHEGWPRPAVVSTYEEAWANLLHEVRQLVNEKKHLTERLRVVVRPVDKVNLAKRLFVKRMGQTYVDVSDQALEDLWQGLDARDQNHWLAVADEAIRLIQVTDLP